MHGKRHREVFVVTLTQQELLPLSRTNEWCALDRTLETRLSLTYSIRSRPDETMEPATTTGLKSKYSSQERRAGTFLRSRLE